MRCACRITGAATQTVILLNIYAIWGWGWGRGGQIPSPSIFPPKKFVWLLNWRAANSIRVSVAVICTLRSGSNQSSPLFNFLTWLLTPMLGFETPPQPLPSPSAVLSAKLLLLRAWLLSNRASPCRWDLLWCDVTSEYVLWILMSCSYAVINLRCSLRSKKERLKWNTLLLVPSVCDPVSAINTLVGCSWYELFTNLSSKSESLENRLNDIRTLDYPGV
jgi:hypothetical protein